AAETWSLIGTYFIGTPVGHRFIEKFGADIIVHTQYGISLLSEVLLGVTEKGTYSGINNKIQGLLQLYNGSHDDRWQVINLPEENLLIKIGRATCRKRGYRSTTDT